MENNFNIRKLCKKDIKQILKLRIDLIKHTSSTFKDTAVDEDSLFKSTNKYLKNNLNKRLFMYGVFINNQLVCIGGYELFQCFPSEDNLIGLEAHLCSIFTIPEFRKRGYGSQIIDLCINDAKSKGVVKLKLGTLNPEAIKIYEKFGFHKSNSTYSLKIN